MTAQGRAVTSQMKTGVVVVTDERGLPHNRKTGPVRRIAEISSELHRSEHSRKATRVYTVVFTDGAKVGVSPAQTWTLASEKQIAELGGVQAAPAAPAKRSRKAKAAKPAAKRGPAAKGARYAVIDGAELKAAVKAAGSTYRKLGAEVGVNPHTINKLVVGRVASVPEATAVAIVLGLGVELDALFALVASSEVAA